MGRTCPAAAGGCGVWVGSAVAGNASLTDVGVAVAPADSLAGVVTGVGVARGGVGVARGGVRVGSGVPTGVVTWVGVAVGVGVGVAVGSGVGVAVGSGVGVAVGVSVGSGVPTGVVTWVGVAVGVEPTHPLLLLLRLN